MRNRSMEDSVYLLGGALLGAAAMFLLDPEAGEKRRRRIAAQAENAYDAARHAIDDGLHSAAHQAYAVKDRLAHHVNDVHDAAAAYAHDLAAEAKHLTSGLADRAAGYARAGSKQAEDYRRQGLAWGDSLAHDAQSLYSSSRKSARDYARGAGRTASDYADQGQSYLSSLGHQIYDRARELGGKLSGYAGSAASHADDARRQASRQANLWGRSASKGAAQARSWFHSQTEPEGFGTGTVLSTALGFCAVGAGVMYFFDPNRGEKRRQWIADQVSDCVAATGRIMRSAGHDISEHLRGAVGQAQSIAHEGLGHIKQRVDSGELLGRIRSEVSSTIPAANNVQFMTEADGTVTVTGRIEPSQLDTLLSALHRIPGVNHVINRTEVRSASAGMQSSMPESSPATQPATNF